MPAMRSLTATLGLALLLVGSASERPVHAQPRWVTADEPRDQVELRAQLDAVAHRIEGTLRWRFTNRSRRPVRELYWHLYLNAFRAEGSLFFREGGSAIRHRQLGGEGGIQVETLTLADGRDLLADATFDLGVANDTTQLLTPLPETLPPGASIELRATFVSQLPEAVARSGYSGSFHVAAQWFPKLARLEPDGTWAHFPYHGLGEFYADYADYTLTVLAPRDFEVVAGGEPLASQAGPAGMRRHLFRAEAVHDIVFVASDELHVMDATQRLPTHDTRVRVVHPPGYEGAATGHLALTRAALDYFSRVFGEYPYSVLTVVVPPAAASAVSGMEYPTLFLTAGPWWGGAAPLAGGGAAETTAHELAHQWFQGLVGTNEVRYPALDEGLTSWATREYFRASAGATASGGRLGSVTFDGFELERSWGLARETPRAPLSPVYDFGPEAYFRTVYVYVPLMLETLARTWGRERLLRALGRYAREQRFAHPGPEALYEAFREEYGAWFVRDVLRPGFARGCVARTELGERTRECDAEGCHDVVVARRSGCLPIPLQVSVETSGARSVLDWPAHELELRVRVPEGTLRRVEIDPTRRNLTDVSRLDGVRSYGDAARDAGHHAGASLTTRLLGVFQLLFSLVGP